MADFDIKDFTTGLAKTIKAIVAGGKLFPGHVLYDEAGNPLPTGAGATTADTLRVALASDSPGVTPPTTGSAVPAAANFIAGLAKTSNPTAASDGNLTGVLLDKLGKLVVVPAIRDLISDQNTTITASTSATTIVAAQGAGVFADLASLTLTNISATGTEVQLFNDDGTTIRWVGYVPPTDMRGIVFPVILPAAAANVTWKLKTVTSITSLKVTAQFVKNL